MDAAEAVVRSRAGALPPWVLPLSALLAVLGIAYLGFGLFDALAGEMPQDLARRWLEGAYVVRRINPLDVFAGAHAPEPDLGPAHPGGYPPWSTALGLLVAPPIPKPFLRVYFALLNLAALGVVARYAHRLGARHGAQAAWLFVVSYVAIAANAIVLRHGQYGIIVNALLVLLLGALESERAAKGGLWLALSALKPQTSAPFALLWLRRRGVLALVVAGLIVGLGTLAVSAWLTTSPVHLFSQMFGQAANWEGGDAGPLRLLLTWGVPRGIAIPALALGTVGGGAVLLYRFREAEASARAAIACVVGRLWTYHRRYDDVMLVFLLLPLAAAAFERRSRTGWLVFFAVGFTLWVPFREADHGPALITFKVLVWLFGLAWLLRGAKPRHAGNSER